MAQQTAVEWLVDQICTTDMYNIIFKKEIEQAKQMEKEQMLGFHKWMKENDTADNAKKYFHYSDEDMLNEYFKK